MSDKPIIFNGDMIRAILDGRKTMTRRPIRPQPYIDSMGNACWNEMDSPLRRLLRPDFCRRLGVSAFGATF